MKLDDCPLCQVVEHAADEEGRFCVKGKLAFHPFDPGSLLDAKMTLVPVATLKSHDVVPSPEAIAEAMEMLQPTSGMIEEVGDVAGHWALWVMPGSWSGSGKSGKV